MGICAAGLGIRHIKVTGGEPLVRRDCCQLVKQLKSTPGIEKVTITTNGVLLNDEVMEFCNREMSNVVLSLDGRPEVNDKMRPFRNGKGSYELIVPKFQKFAELRDQNNYYVRGTFTRHNLDFAADVLHYADLGFKQMSMEPVVAPPEEDYAIREEDIPQILEEYDKLALEYIKRKKEGRGFNFFHFMLDLNAGPCVAKRLAGCGSGTSATTAAATEAATEAKDTTAADTTAADTAAADTTAAEKTASDKTYIINTDTTFAPFEFENEKGDLVGIDMDILKAVAEDQGFSYEVVPVGFSAATTALEAGECDGVIAGMSITSERSQSVDFSDPYYNANIVAVVAADGPYADVVNVTDFEGATLTSTLNTVWYDVLDQITDYATKDAALDTFASMVAAVHAGKIDGFTCDMPSAKSILVSNPDLKIIDFEGGTGFEVSNEETDLGIPCQKGNTELVDKINEVLAGLSKEDRDAMMDQAVASQPVSN